jgi:hypothetical protein
VSNAITTWRAFALVPDMSPRNESSQTQSPFFFLVLPLNGPTTDSHTVGGPINIATESGLVSNGVR